MKSPKPTHQIANGTVRISLWAKMNKPVHVLTFDRRRNEQEPWYPTASFLPVDLPALLASLEQVHTQLAGKNRTPVTGAAPGTTPATATPSATANAPPTSATPIPAMAGTGNSAAQTRAASRGGATRQPISRESQRRSIVRRTKAASKSR